MERRHRRPEKGRGMTKASLRIPVVSAIWGGPKRGRGMDKLFMSLIGVLYSGKVKVTRSHVNILFQMQVELQQ